MDTALDSERFFSLASAAVLPGWLALVLAPLRRPLAVAAARWLAALLCGFYLTMLVTGLTGGHGPAPGASFNSLAGVRLLLSTPEALLAGWVHYLAFDLFVGAWEAADAPQSNVPHWLLLPCLVLTFVAGPTGLLLYLVIRATRQR